MLNPDKFNWQPGMLRVFTEDARVKKPKKPRYRLGSRTIQPAARTLRAMRARERKVEALRRVNVLTAEDKKVCPICEEIAEDGPYPINTARTLIPAHVSCRCAFEPVFSMRDAYDPDQPRKPKGDPEGGQWTEEEEDDVVDRTVVQAQVYGNVSPEYKEKVERAFAAVSPKLRERVRTSLAVYEKPEDHSDIDNLKIDRATAFYEFGKRHVGFIESGTKSYSDLKAVAAHELGHGLDDILNASANVDFSIPFRKDVRAMHPFDKRDYSYFLTRSEAFAEIVAHLSEGNEKAPILKRFPNTVGYIRGLLRRERILD